MKRFFITFTISFAVLMLGIFAYVWMVDPFFHYHAPKAAIGGYMDNAVYHTPGAARHLDYDAAIVGSSMTENMRASWFEELGLNAIKLSYSGAEMKDYATILDMVFSKNPDIDMVVMDINEFQLVSDPEAVCQEYPEYLYNPKWYTDTQYVYNNDVFWISGARLLEKLSGNQKSMDDSYTWEEPEHFSHENVYKDYQMSIDRFAEGRDMVAKADSYDDMRRLAHSNLAQIIPYIKEHPDTRFEIFYPPYSILYWKDVEFEGKLDAVMDMYQYSIDELSQYENVDIYYFHGNTDIITDLDRYRDVCHHDPAANRYIFDCIKERYMIIKENVKLNVVNDVSTMQDRIRIILENKEDYR